MASAMGADRHFHTVPPPAAPGRPAAGKTFPRSRKDLWSSREAYFWPAAVTTGVVCLCGMMAVILWGCWLAVFEDAPDPEITLTWNVKTTGRVFLVVSTDLAAEPRKNVKLDFSSAQIFGADVRDARKVVFPNNGQTGFPHLNFHDLPARQVRVQAVLTPYQKYTRQDGNSVHLPAFKTFTSSLDLDDFGFADVDEFGLGGPLTAEGVTFSQAINIAWPIGDDLEINLDRTDGPRPSMPTETEYSKFVTVRSQNLSAFWGQDVNVSAWVLLPAGFHDSDARYPLIINHGRYSNEPFRGWAEVLPERIVSMAAANPGNPEECNFCSTTACPCNISLTSERQFAFNFRQNWTSLGTSSSYSGARVLLVRVQTPNPFFDDSYSINSENMGPYGDAVNRELIPEIERRFRGIGQPWARGLYGRGSGAWEALASQILYPDEYNGCIAHAPDPVDFHSFMTLDIYNKDNAFRESSSHLHGVRPFLRTSKGEVLLTMEQVDRYERAMGGFRSGGKLFSWFAAFGPKGPDGMPKALWKPDGSIDRSVANYLHEHFDLSGHLQRHWSEDLAAKLAGKIKINVGMMDNYYYNNAVSTLQNVMEKTSPPLQADFQYGSYKGRGFGHAWTGSMDMPMRVGDLTAHMRAIQSLVQGFLLRAPAGADVSSWRY
mmetsp:Transcript_69220/g.150631  ORF Transcript_69220/g.150631 Transcript_69220/m.150631 type:complete len:659 (+) Transcript_69220:67-2043(+)|eukprot:CAMPEP_0170605974 /NCGR_PEP_ID=MMETSP0224-20130122/20257_1 /TAXON_ID=285029 /ORGANISM="Togula jolla, Strain CCCM 725" /LENGTH=658 /DNA_ID=CAMNT_0010931009 /DNA_START=62 /DNA_END=2038 /DNA_ORIENTATION=-